MPVWEGLLWTALVMFVLWAILSLGAIGLMWALDPELLHSKRSTAEIERHRRTQERVRLAKEKENY